jgi:hypothetical protein
MQCTPSYIRQWMGEKSSLDALGQLEQLLVGGEALSADLAELLSEQVSGKVFNMYGPTETTVWSAISEVTSRNVQIGRPFVNTQFYVLDKLYRLVPQGIIGELYIGGRSLSPGYFKKSELTNRQFIPNPFSTDESDLLYRTGDLVRRLGNGSLEFLGRVDHQVKIRGYRVELGEIESALMSLLEVKEAVVLVSVEAGNCSNQSLTAYIVPAVYLQENETATTLSQQSLINTIRSALQRHIPDYMLPNEFILLDTLPLMPNGKLDRKALRTHGKQKVQHTDYVAPTNDVERQLCAIWQDTLKLDQIGIHDNFFRLGGHSLLTVQMALNINTQFPSTTIEIADILSNPTIATLAKLLNVYNEKDIDPVINLESELFDFVNEEHECTEIGNYRNPAWIFITDVTTFLGIQLLKNFISKTDARIYCLTSDQEEGCINQIKSICLHHKIKFEPEDWQRLEYVKGTLNHEYLGMDLSAYQKIISNVDIIVHNGENSDSQYSYQQLKKVNVNSTYELIKIAKLTKKKQLIFLSTTGVSSEASSPDENINVNSLSFRESQGYLASKWVAEAMIKRANINYKIHRVPRVGGNVDSEHGLLHELMYRFTDLEGTVEAV